jgi:hypothetical protein
MNRGWTWCNGDEDDCYTQLERVDMIWMILCFDQEFGESLVLKSCSIVSQGKGPNFFRIRRSKLSTLFKMGQHSLA